MDGLNTKSPMGGRSKHKIAYEWTDDQSHLHVDGLNTIVILLQISDSFTSDSTWMNLSTNESGFITFHIPTVPRQTMVGIGGQLMRRKITLVQKKKKPASSIKPVSSM